MRILITGATSGIGRQLALDYHKEGHTVWAIGRNQSALDELAGKGLRTAGLDLTRRNESLDFFAGLDALDLAILNAGGCEYINLPNFDSALFTRVMRANVESMAVSVEGVLPLLRKGAQPHLATMGSSSVYLPLPRAEAYGASKAAIAYMTNSLRIGLFKEKITVSLICPGFVQTPLTDRNDFPMPFCISVEKASRYIRAGIARRKKEIHFPRHFTQTLKILGWLPSYLWIRLAQRITRK